MSTKNDKRTQRRKLKREKEPIYDFNQELAKTITYWFSMGGRGCSIPFIPNLEYFLGYGPKELYQFLMNWLDNPCEECGVIIDKNNKSIDHILPKSLAKTKEEILKYNSLDNLRLICRDCNIQKGDLTGDPQIIFSTSEEAGEYMDQQMEKLLEEKMKERKEITKLMAKDISQRQQSNLCHFCDDNYIGVCIKCDTPACFYHGAVLEKYNGFVCEDCE